jgi:hypothetical protein
MDFSNPDFRKGYWHGIHDAAEMVRDGASWDEVMAYWGSKLDAWANNGVNTPGRGALPPVFESAIGRAAGKCKTDIPEDN